MLYQRFLRYYLLFDHQLPTVYKPIARMYNLFILSVEPAFKSKDVAVVFVIATLTVDSLIGLVWVTNAE